MFFYIVLTPISTTSGLRNTGNMRKYHQSTYTFTSVINTIKQQQNHRLRTDSSLSHRGGGGGVLNAYNWCQIFTLNSVVVKTQKMFSSHGGFLTNAMNNHAETLESNYHTMMNQRKWLVSHI